MSSGQSSKTARELGEQLVHLAQRQHDSGLLLEAHYALGTVLIYLGELATARIHLEQGSALYDTQQHHALTFRYGAIDPGVASLCSTILVLWYLGYPERALHKSHEALTLAQDLSHPNSLTLALFYRAMLHQLRQEERATQEQAETLLALSTEQGSPFSLAMGIMLQGWALAAQGQGAAGLSPLREGLAAYRATGAELLRSVFLGFLAESYAQGSQFEAGLATVVEALGVVEITEERLYEAELYRLKGALLLQHSQDNQPEAEACFRKALEIAQKQQAKSWELRAATSLARLWQGQGKTTEACDLLTPVYNWFTEGFDTRDLKDAKALLEGLT